MKSKLLAALALAAAALGAALSAETPFYDIKAELDPKSGKIEGDFQIACPLAPGQKALYLAMDLNLGEKPNPKLAGLIQKKGPTGFDPSYARALGLKVDGREASASFEPPAQMSFQAYSLDHVILRIDLPEASLGKDSARLSFRYQAKLSDMRGGMDDEHTSDFFISRFSWFPRIADPTALDASRLDPFRYRAEIDCAAEGWELLPTGTGFEEASPGSWKISSELPLASLPLVLVKGFESYALPFEEGKKTLRLYYRKGCDFAARSLATQALDALAFYKDRYYPLDYPTVSVVQGLPGSYGMGADAVVVLGSTLFDGLDSLVPRMWDRLAVFVLSHELGHFYFGIGSPPDFARQNYLSEGLNELSTMRLIEKKYGPWENIRNKDQDDLGEALFGGILSASLGGDSWRAVKYAKILGQERAGWVYPISHEVRDTVLNATSVTDYDRSQIVLEMLGGYMGREAFDAGLEAYLLAGRGRPSSTAFFKAEMEKAAGRALDSFFDAYVTGKEDLDYSLSGSLNAGSAGAYRQELRIGFKGEGPFVPVTLRLALPEGKSKDLLVAAPGPLSLETEDRVSCAILDPDFRTIDYRRLDNALPRQVRFAESKNFSLVETGAALGINSAMTVALAGSYGFIGENLSLGLPGYWKLMAAPMVGVDLNDLLGQGIRFATIASLDLPSPGGVSVGVKAFHDLGGSSAGEGAPLFDPAPALPSSVALSLSWSPAMRPDLGYAATYVSKPLALSGSFGLSKLGAGQAVYFQEAAASLDLLQLIGLGASLGDSLRLPLGSMAAENRIGLELSESFSPLPGCLVALNASGAWTAGTVSALGNGNEVKGFSSAESVGSSRAFRAGAGAFLGFSLFNGKNLRPLRGVTLQSLHLGLAYDAATAFDAPGQAYGNVQQSIGLVLAPTIRTILDSQATLGLGAALSLTRIMEAPGDPASYAPGFYLDLSAAPLMGSLFAY